MTEWQYFFSVWYSVGFVSLRPNLWISKRPKRYVFHILNSLTLVLFIPTASFVVIFDGRISQTIVYFHIYRLTKGKKEARENKRNKVKWKKRQLRIRTVWLRLCLRESLMHLKKETEMQLFTFRWKTKQKHSKRLLCVDWCRDWWSIW